MGASPLKAQQTTPADSSRHLIIGTKEVPPFMMKDEAGQWTGLTMVLWQKIAEANQWSYDFREQELDSLLLSVAQERVDAVVAAVTITKEREETMDFSQPFYYTGLGIAVNAESGSVWASIKRLVSIDFIRAVGALVIVLLIFGLLIWAFERRRNPEQFGGKAFKGIGAGFWWSAVTMTTVGYGDKAPVTPGGRMVALIWMFMALIIISSFTAAIASAITVGQLSGSISGPEDLDNAKVGTLGNTASADYLDLRDINYKTYNTVPELLEALSNGKIEAAVYDAPLLQYLSQQQPELNIKVLPRTFQQFYYGIALPNNSPLRETLNITLLEVLRSQDWKDARRSYTGNSNSQ